MPGIYGSTANLDQICRLDTASGIITTLTEADGYEKQTYGEGSSAAKRCTGKFIFRGLGASPQM